MASNNRLTLGYYIALACLIIITFYFGLANYPLANNNEGLYAEVAREMLVTGNYIIPHLNFVPYIEKPPLLYWLITLSYHIFGVTAFAARVVTTSCAALTVLCILWFGDKIGRAMAAWLAAVILTTSIGFIISARVVFFDMLLTACLTFTLSLFYLWWYSNKKAYLYAAYIFLSGAILSKGLLSLVLVSAICIIFLLAVKQKDRIINLFNPIGISLFLLLVLPWHIIAGWQHPGFAYDYFINEQVLRFLNERTPHDYYQGPIYYYIPRLIIYIFPWCLCLPVLFKRKASEVNSTDKLSLFLSLWLIIPLIFFSLSQAKANYYMIISVPALAFLLALKLNDVFLQQKFGIFTWLFGCLTLLFASTLIYSLLVHDQINHLQYQLLGSIKIWLVILLGYSIILLLLSIWYYVGNKQQKTISRQSQQVQSMSLLAGVCGITLLILSLGYIFLKKHENMYAELNIVKYLQSQPKVKPVFYYKNYAKQSTLLFYLQRRLPIINAADPDLYYGSRQPDAKGWFISANLFDRIAKNEFLYVAVTKENVAAFRHTINFRQFCAVAASAKGLLLSNDPTDCSLHSQ